MSEAVEVQAERLATGGEAVAHLEDGRVVFVRGALPGEHVRIALTEQKKRFARARVLDVLSPAPERVEPDCAHAGSGECGGCDWMHIDPAAQTTLKRQLVIEQLQRLGGVSAPSVVIADNPRGQRTTVRCAVNDGRLGYRSRQSARSFAAERCPAAHPLVEELIIDARFGSSREVTLRVAPSTHERMAIVDGPIDEVRVPGDVLVVSASDPAQAAIHELIQGRPWRISANSFFQTSSEGATALVASVALALEGEQGPIVDLYAGVGLLGGAAAPLQLVTAVEQSPSSVADAIENLDDAVDVVAKRVERWSPTPHDGVIADPARRGLGADGVGVIDGTGARRLVLVSCDPASLGRDAGLLVADGWSLRQSEVIDMFPDTSRIEVVSAFSR